MLAGIFFLVGAVLLAVSCILLYAAAVFRKFPDRTARAAGLLAGTKHKKNVTVHGRHLSDTMFLKHLTKGTYAYTVNGKHYALRNFTVGTPKEVERAVAVRYLKRFPRIAYLEDGVSDGGDFLLWGVLLLVAAAGSVVLAVCISIGI